jgi:hypothetical protein
MLPASGLMLNPHVHFVSASSEGLQLLPCPDGMMKPGDCPCSENKSARICNSCSSIWIRPLHYTAGISPGRWGSSQLEAALWGGGLWTRIQWMVVAQAVCTHFPLFARPAKHRLYSVVLIRDQLRSLNKAAWRLYARPYWAQAAPSKSR